MFLILLLKGFLIGIAFIIPGVSGGSLAIYLGVYDKLIYSITHVFKELKKSILFLLPLGIGLFLSIILFAKLLGLLIALNSVITLSFFIGLLLGGIPSLYQKIKDKKKSISSIISFSVSFIIVLLLLFGKLGNISSAIDTFDFNAITYLLIFGLGFISAVTMIVPGVSGSALLITLGFYTAIVTNVVGNILDFTQFTYNLKVVIPFGLGAILGVFIVSKFIEISMKKFFVQTYSAIIGFIFSSAIVIFFEMKDQTSSDIFENQIPVYQNIYSYLQNNIFSIVFAIVAIILGFFIAQKLVMIDRLFKNGQTKNS